MKPTTHIELTQGYKAKIDKEDLGKVKNKKWFAQVVKIDGVIRTVYAKCRFENNYLPMTNLILDLPRGVIVDHKDGDGLNNTKANLRVATPQQNAHNRRLGRNNTSGFKGVVWEKDRQKWKARIKLNGKYTTLGRFTTKESAAKAYAEASKRLHGEFGRTE